MQSGWGANGCTTGTSSELATDDRCVMLGSGPNQPIDVDWVKIWQE
jgi:hypothetical protein